MLRVKTNFGKCFTLKPHFTDRGEREREESGRSCRPHRCAVKLRPSSDRAALTAQITPPHRPDRAGRASSFFSLLPQLSFSLLLNFADLAAADRRPLPLSFTFYLPFPQSVTLSSSSHRVYHVYVITLFYSHSHFTLKPSQIRFLSKKTQPPPVYSLTDPRLQGLRYHRPAPASAGAAHRRRNPGSISTPCWKNFSKFQRGLHIWSSFRRASNIDRFISFCAPEQIRLDPEKFISVCKRFKELVIILGTPVHVHVDLFLAAVRKLQNSSEHLTTLHPHFIFFYWQIVPKLAYQFWRKISLKLIIWMTFSSAVIMGCYCSNVNSKFHSC